MAVAPPAAAHIPATNVASAPWLTRFNAWRANTGSAALTENTTWSSGDYAHAQYMVKNDLVTHYETPGTAYYTADGDTAARNSNIYVSSSTATTDNQAIDWWMQAPFHAMGMVDPRLTTTAFGSYREVKSGWDMGAAVDVLRGNSFSGGHFPVYFPGNGTSEPLTSYGGFESPDPLQACAGYAAPTGLPVFVELGGNIGILRRIAIGGGGGERKHRGDDRRWSGDDRGSADAARCAVSRSACRRRGSRTAAAWARARRRDT